MLIGKHGSWFTMFLLCCLAHSPCFGEQKFALLIGNQSYHQDVGPLQNPHNDVDLVANALKQVKFDWVEVKKGS
jgi:hypothetical protein